MPKLCHSRPDIATEDAAKHTFPNRQLPAIVGGLGIDRCATPIKEIRPMAKPKRKINAANHGKRPACSGCFGWGHERWVYAIFIQFGLDPKNWPEQLARDFDLWKGENTL